MKMLDAWTYRLKSNTVAGIELNLLPDGGMDLHVMLLKKEKNQLLIEKTASGLKSIEELSGIVPLSVPICLAIDGKGLMHKKITAAEGDTQQTLLNKMLPNARPDDFYVESAPAGMNVSFVSVVRKALLDQLLEQFQKLKWYVIDCRMGPWKINGLLPLLKRRDESGELKLGHYLFEVSGNAVLDFHKTADVTDASIELINDEQLPVIMAPAYAAAMSYYTMAGDPVSFVPAVQGAGEEFRQKRIFTFTGWAALAFFFGLLLLNFFMFSYFSGEKTSLQRKVDLNKDELAHYQALQKQYGLQQTFLQKSGLLADARTAYYADRLASDMPAGIRLDNLNIRPLVKTSEDDNTLVFSPDRIEISGTCNATTELNNWIKIIKEKKWVKGANLQNYKLNNDNGKGLFWIRVKIK